MESLYLRGHAIQEVGGKVSIGSSVYGVAVIDGLLGSRFYTVAKYLTNGSRFSCLNFSSTYV